MITSWVLLSAASAPPVSEPLFHILPLPHLVISTSNTESFERQHIRNTKSKQGNIPNFLLSIQITQYNMNTKLDLSLGIIFNFSVFANNNPTIA